MKIFMLNEYPLIFINNVFLLQRKADNADKIYGLLNLHFAFAHLFVK